jgi:hypothetical protein
LEDLREHFKDMVDLFTDDSVPGIRKVEELEVEVA